MFSHKIFSRRIFSQRAEGLRKNLLGFCALLLATAAFVNSFFPSADTAWATVLSQGSAATSQTFNYQGVLRGVDGTPVTGLRDMTLRIYDSITGGTVLHTETVEGVVVRDGVFNVVVGDATALNLNVFTNDSLYIGVTIGTDPELQPRQRIHAVPWALALAPGSVSPGDIFVEGTISATDVFVEGTISATDVFVEGTISATDGGNSLDIAANNSGRADIRANRRLDINALGNSDLRLNSSGNVGDVFIGSNSDTIHLNGEIRTQNNTLAEVIRVRLNDNDTIPNRNANTWTCMIVGYDAGTYDIQEDGAHSERMRLVRSGNQWRLDANLPSHNDSEELTLDILCLHENLVDDDR